MDELVLILISSHAQKKIEIEACYTLNTLNKIFLEEEPPACSHAQEEQTEGLLQS